ncbi:MAG TPA: XRE family transcriptional regulator [Bradyrhizobium sp.]|nr:XRE family transcriptional regulator [Bradyrhizobium sp.]
MDVRPLHNERDYDWAINEVTRYFDDQPSSGTPDGDRFEILTALIHAYEEKHFEMPHADPIEVLNFAIESMGRSQAELGNLIGRNRASEILNRIRPLTLDMIRDISAEWKIPIELLTPKYDLARASA